MPRRWWLLLVAAAGLCAMPGVTGVASVQAQRGQTGWTRPGAYRAGITGYFSIAGPDYTAPDTAALSQVMQDLYTHAPMFRQRIQFLATKGVTIAVGHHLPFDGQYVRKRITIDMQAAPGMPPLSKAERAYRLAEILTEEVEHAYQDHTLGLPPQPTRQQQLFFEADARSMSAQVLWQYSQGSGAPIWQYLTQKSEEAPLFAAFYARAVMPDAKALPQAARALRQAFYAHASLVSHYAQRRP